MRTYHLLFFAIIACCQPGFSQQQFPTQSIRGVVLDRDTRQPLIGATVSVADLDPILGAITEVDGSFTIENVPIGRHSIEASYIGYSPWRTEGLVLTETRELVLEIELKEQASVLGEVVVKAVASPHQSQNDAAVLSARSFSVEEVQHFAGAINDPGRMAQSLPGVQPSKDNEGDIIVRGNSSAGVLWRLEGIDILNPNHFARLGGSGGGLTIFSVSVLGTSDLFTGAFPAEYGNALAGVFDMRFRNGNRERRQHTFKAGMLGLEAAVEGPFSVHSSQSAVNSLQSSVHGSDRSGVIGHALGQQPGSYLVNYRYSTLGILNKMGIYLVGERVSNNFQDLSFNLFFPGKKENSAWRVWGAGGLSFEEKTAAGQADWQKFEDSTRYESGSDVGILGVTHTRAIGHRSHLKVSGAVMAQRTFYNFHREFGDARPAQVLQDENYVQGKAALSSFFTHKISARFTVKTGLQMSALRYDMQFDTIQPDGALFSYIGENGTTWQVQPFAQISYSPLPQLAFHAGLHAFYFGLTKSFSPEPRLSTKVQLNERQSLSLAAGLHSQTVPLGVYFIQLPGNDSTAVFQPNRQLDLMRSVHYVLAYDNLISQQFRLHIEAYFQQLWDVPANGTFWLLNEFEGYPARQLFSKGKGRNMGVDASLEKFFRQGLFFILNASIFESVWQNGGREYNTQYNNNFTAALTTGKEWITQKGGTFQAGMKFLYLNKIPSTPLASVQLSGEEPTLDDAHPYSDRIKTYWRTDLRLAWRKGRVKLSLDVQNLLNRKNERPFGWEYSLEQKQWLRKTQAGLTPVLAFAVDF